MAWTFIAQRAVTGEFLDWDLPLEINGLEWQLSGAGSLKATVSPDVGGLRGDDGRLLLEEWGTFLYAEHGGQIRWGGILVQSTFNGEEWDLEAAGFATYLHARHYQGELSEIGYDVADAVRAIWADVQRFPDGDLGVTVVGPTATGVKLGTAAWTEPRLNEDGSPDLDPDGVQRVTEHDAAPYALLAYEAPNCGAEMDELAKAAPFDWVENHRWSGDRESIVHEFEIVYPRRGRRRDDLSFVQGDNVVSVVSIESNGDEFANTIIGLGAGEGRAMLRRETSVRDGRLRREHVYADKAITDTGRMDALIADELNHRKAAVRIESLDVIDHPNAPIGSWQLGDDVLVRAQLPWLGEVEMTVRITGWSLTGDHTATLSVTRSDLFRYGG